MRFKVHNKTLIEDVRKTYFTVASDAADVTLVVKDIEGFGIGDYVIIGEIGEEGTEIVRVHAATAPAGTTITLVAGGLAYGHPVDTPIYRADYNQVRFSRAVTVAGAKVTLATQNIDPSEDFCYYDDTSNTTGYGFVRWQNSSDNTNSAWSGVVNYTHSGEFSSFDPRTLIRMAKGIRVLVDEDRVDSKVTDDQIRDVVNDTQRNIGHRRLWSFYEIERSFSSVDDKFAYDIPSTVQKVHSATFDTQPLAEINRTKWKNLHWDTDQTTTDPGLVSIWNNQLLVYPRPSSSADTTTLSALLSSTAVTATVADTSSFNRGDYYRFIIDNEVIYATGATSTTFTGLLRGQEGTMAASHASSVTITERDLVYAAHVEPTNLFLSSDRTEIPEPEVLELGSAAKLAFLLEKETLADRLEQRFQTAIVSLESKYASKFSQQFPRIKNRDEIVSDNSNVLNANLYPKSIG